jgi:hypothetical protein
MRSLYAIRQDLHAALERFHSLKTKAAKLKLRDGKLAALRTEARDVMESVFKPGDVITLDYSVNCTTPTGGGWGCKGTVTILDVYGGELHVDCQGTVMIIEIMEDWKRWGQDSFWAFETAFRERGQDVGFEAREHAIGVITRSLRSTLRCRNAKSVVDGKPLRASVHFQQRLQAMIGELRNLKLQQLGGAQ